MAWDPIDSKYSHVMWSWGNHG